MVLTFDVASREAVICAAWGPETDWFRNLQAGPAVGVDIGRDHFVPAHRFLTVDEGVRVADAFRREHPHRLRLMQTILGWGDLSDDAVLRDFVAAHPMVAFRPSVEA